MDKDCCTVACCDKTLCDIKDIISSNTMSHYLTKEDLYEDVYKKICKYISERQKNPNCIK